MATNRKQSCYAGAPGLIGGEDRSVYVIRIKRKVIILTKTRLFEYLATVYEVTPVPGPDSFTRALINSLKILREESKEGRFTTLDLLNRIKNQESSFVLIKTPKPQAL